MDKDIIVIIFNFTIKENRKQGYFIYLFLGRREEKTIKKNTNNGLISGYA
jgi:hypothetical protein